MGTALRTPSADRDTAGGIGTPPVVSPVGLAVAIAAHGPAGPAADLAARLRDRGHRVAGLHDAGGPADAIVLVASGARAGLADACRAMRDAHGAAVVLVVGDGGVEECIAVLDAGADDHLRLPCSATELESRIRALLRRRRPAPVERIAAGDIVLEPSSLSAWAGNRPVALTTAEFRVLEALVRHPNRVLDRDDLRDAMDTGRFATSRTVDVCIHSLRRKLAHTAGDGPIDTVRGVGYRLRAPRAA